MKHSRCAMFTIATILIVLIQAATADRSMAAAGFALKDQPGQHVDILLDGRIVGRYMYAYDTSTPQRLKETYKPYLHVFDASGDTPITKGPGGQYTHHRGIFIGWNKIRFDGKTYDRWHMRGGEIVHQEFLSRAADADQAIVTSVTHWNDESKDAILVEQRTMSFRRAPGLFRVLIDFKATLTAHAGDVLLDGDPEHAGVQYRPANEIDASQTTYVFPNEQADPKQDLDYPWVGETYTLDGDRHSVVQLNHPGNPQGTKFSAYRDYGRFGAFFIREIPAGEALTVNYRFLIADGEMPSASIIQKCWDQFADVDAPSATPNTTVISAGKK